MAVSANTVYQRVLAILNKEQRGYVTPEEFNLFANQAQLDIFEQYFFDINQFGRLHGNDTEYSDMLDVFNKKIQPFEKISGALTFNSSGRFTLPDDLYRLGTVVFANKEVQRVEYNEYLYIAQSPLVKPTDNRPVYHFTDTGLAVFGDNQITSGVTCSYIKKPSSVIWNFDTVLGNAVYKASGTVDFELEPSEEPDLVIKILGLCGLEIRDTSLYQVSVQEEIRDTQEEKQ